MFDRLHETFYKRNKSNGNPMSWDYARLTEYVLPTTKSCPLIKPAETSSCATPSAVSEWGTNHDKTDMNKAQNQIQGKENTRKDPKKLVSEASWQPAKGRGRKWASGRSGCTTDSLQPVPRDSNDEDEAAMLDYWMLNAPNIAAMTSRARGWRVSVMSDINMGQACRRKRPETNKRTTNCSILEWHGHDFATAIAFFTVHFSHLVYNVIQCGCEEIWGRN